MLIEVKGLVIRTVDLKESDRLVTLFTEEEGVITALARGARSLKSRKMAATTQFCYGSFILFGHSDKYQIREAELIESFFDIRNSIEGLALAGYIAEVLDDVGVTEAERELLRLSLNSLYAIASGKYPLDKIKATFEVRAMSILGFMPDVLSCSACGERYGDFYFDIMAGALECRECRRRSEAKREMISEPHESHIISILTEGAKDAFAYSVHAPQEKIFSYSVSDEDMHLFARAAEEYLTNHLERSYRALKFYNEVKR